MSQFDDDDSQMTIFGGSLIAPLPASPDAPGHYLVVMEGIDPGKYIEVNDEPLTIGRDAKQNVVFAGDTMVSRAHARVSLVKGEVVAHDLGSTNGTFVNAQRITAPVVLKEGHHLRIGHQLLKYERRSRKDVQRAEELARDLRKASGYVLALLPPPLASAAVKVDWHFQPSAQLGGDAFGYDWLDPTTFVFYLVDVSGHGVGSAMHSVTVMNVLRQRALPGVDFKNPADVLASLNARFQMAAHNGLFFTIWYGVYATDMRTLVFSVAGHHPAFVIPPDRATTEPLGESDLMIGVAPDQQYALQRASIAPGTRLYLFSDGVFEIVTTEGTRWGLENFLPLLLEPNPGPASEPARLFNRVHDAARAGGFDDDFSLMTVTFL